MADLARDEGNGKKRGKVFARFRRTPKARLPPLSFSLSFIPSLLSHSLLFALSLSRLLVQHSRSPSPSAAAFRHSRISRSYFDPRRVRASSRAEPSVFPLLPCPSRSPEEWRDVDQTLAEPTGAKAKDGVGRKGTVDGSFSSFLFPAPVSRSRVGATKREIEDAGGREEDG